MKTLPLLAFVLKRDPTPVAYDDVQEYFGCPRSSATAVLQRLRNNGLLRRFLVGRRYYYSITRAGRKKIRYVLETLLESGSR